MVQGKHAQYPMLIHKFQCTDGALKGMRLNAWESASYQELKYDPCPEQCTDGAPVGALTVPQSTREGEKKRINTPKAPPLGLDFPDWIPVDAWNAFQEMRKAERHPLTPAATKLAISKLDKLRSEGQDIRAVLEDSALKGYRGLFPVNGTSNSNGHLSPVKPKSQYEMDAESQRDERRRAMREAGIQ
jgi:hypothetical protein